MQRRRFLSLVRQALDALPSPYRDWLANVDVVIDTDSHHVSDLVRMKYGVEYARRGWVTTDRVINAQPVDDFMAWVGRRRG